MRLLEKLKNKLNQGFEVGAIDYLKEQANLSINKKEYKNALEPLHSIIKLRPNDDEAIKTLAKIYLINQQLDKGVEYVLKSLELNKANPSTINLVIDYLHQFQSDKKPNDALALLETALDYAPNDDDLLFFKSQKQFESGQFRDAYKTLKTLLQYNPDHVEATVGLAYSLIELGKKTEALKYVQWLQKIDKTRSDELLAAIYEAK